MMQTMCNKYLLQASEKNKPSYKIPFIKHSSGINDELHRTRVKGYTYKRNAYVESLVWTHRKRVNCSKLTGMAVVLSHV